MGEDERLRRRFGPPSGPGRLTTSSGQPRWRRWLWAPIAALLLGGSAAVALVVTPHDHIAPGCFWWTADEVGQVVPGRHGCVRGYLLGGALADSTSQGSFRVALDESRVRCPFAPGMPVVVRYHAVFDDGRTIVVIDACRW